MSVSFTELTNELFMMKEVLIHVLLRLRCSYYKVLPTNLKISPIVEISMFAHDLSRQVHKSAGGMRHFHLNEEMNIAWI